MKYPGITIGLQLAVTMLVFIYGGYKLDHEFQKSPLFLLLGVVIGFVVGFYNLLRELKYLDKNIRAGKSLNKDKGTKWM